MTRQVFNICLSGLLLMGTSHSLAQSKNVIISDELSATAEMWKVKLGTQAFGKIKNFQFGDYTIVKSKMGWTVTDQNSNLINTKTESSSENKFSFVLDNKTSDSAIVNAIRNMEVKEIQSIELFPHFYFGEDELVSSSTYFLSFITRSNNRDETWILSKEETYGSEVEDKFEASLRNGDRIIHIIPASSNKYGEEPQMLPARGYEFVENKKSLCAMQYLASGAFGTNKSIVWLKSDLDPEMKLILAAAMTSLML